MTGSPVPDYVRFAAELASKIASVKCEGATPGEREKKAGLVRRAQEFPSLMLSFGFFPAFTFYLSKLEAKDYTRLASMLDYLRGKNNSGKEFCEELRPSEGGGYVGYVAVLVMVLETVKSLNLNVQGDPMSVFKALIETAEKVTFKDQWAISLYVNEAKKVLEAMPV